VKVLSDSWRLYLPSAWMAIKSEKAALSDGLHIHIAQAV